MSREFESLLVSYITRFGPSSITTEYIEALRARGATVLRGEGATDVSLARCLQAEGVLQYLATDKKTRFHLWLDDDVATSVECTEALLSLCESANKVLPCSVSGAYVNRHRNQRDRQELAACVLKREHRAQPMRLQLVSIGADVLLQPALTGLGCLMQPRSVFIAHCEESPVFSYGPIGRMVHEVCNSRMIGANELSLYFQLPEDARSLRFWHGEDFDYCTREFMCDRAVFLAPIDFAHQATTVILPSNETILPGLTKD